MRFSYVTGWAPVPAREPRQSLRWRRIIRCCFKCSHSVSVALFPFKCCHSQTLCCFHPITLMLRNLHLGAPLIFLPSTVLVCILHHMFFLDAEGVGFEFLSSSDTTRQPVLASDFLFFLFPMWFFFKNENIPLYFLSILTAPQFDFVAFLSSEASGRRRGLIFERENSRSPQLRHELGRIFSISLSHAVCSDFCAPITKAK